MCSSLQALCISKISDNISYYAADIADQHLEYLYITSPFYGVPNTLLQSILAQVADKKKLSVHNFLLFLSGNITEISLRRAPNLVDSRMVKQIVTRCKNLHKLDLFQCRKVNNASIEPLVNFKTLTHINLAGLKEIQDRTISDIILNNPNLIEINLAQIQKISDQTALSIASTCPNLEILDLSGSIVTDKGIHSILTKCNKIMDLKLVACWNVSAWTLLEISQLPQLQTLDLTSCNLTDDVIAQIAQCCIYLKHLHLSGCQELTDTSLDIVTQTLTSLESLSLAGNKAISSFSCLHLHSRLVYLDLSNLDSSQIYYLSLNSITELNLNNTADIDDASIQYVAKQCGMLRKLSVESTEVGDVGMSALVQCHQLRYLSVQKCDITDVGVAAILGGLPLIEIDMSHCGQVTIGGINRGFASMLGAKNSLRVLNIQHCKKITKAEVAALCQMVPKLNVLWV